MNDVAQDPRTWFDARPRVLFVHAHPDDETIATGGTLAALAEAGMEPLLVTLSRGEQGEVVAGPLEALAATHGLAVVRQNELQTALGMLGVERHVFLGVPPARAEGLQPTIYEDSGMAWGADGRAIAGETATPEALTRAPATEVIMDLFAAANESGAGAIVSYNDAGGYGHPDHVLAHRAARAVAHGLGLPFWEIVAPDVADRVAAGERGGDTADDRGDSPAYLRAETHEITPWLDRKVAALRAHTTQLTVDDGDIVHVGGQREAIGDAEAFALRAGPQGLS